MAMYNCWLRDYTCITLTATPIPPRVYLIMHSISRERLLVNYCSDNNTGPSPLLRSLALSPVFAVSFKANQTEPHGLKQNSNFYCCFQCKTCRSSILMEWPSHCTYGRFSCVKIKYLQECIPVGCVPSTAVGAGGVCLGGCPSGGVSARRGVCPGDVCPGDVCPGGLPQCGQNHKCL